jgi:hypothetical protein
MNPADVKYFLASSVIWTSFDYNVFSQRFVGSACSLPDLIVNLFFMHFFPPSYISPIGPNVFPKIYSYLPSICCIPVGERPSFTPI